MKLQLEKDSTDITINIFIQDSAASDGSGKTGLLYTHMAGYYVRPVSTPVLIDFDDQTVTNAYVESGFVLISDAEMPGLYRFDIPNAALATGADSVVIMMTASGAAPTLIEIQLVEATLLLTDILQDTDNPSSTPAPIDVDTNGRIKISGTLNAIDDIALTDGSGRVKQ